MMPDLDVPKCSLLMDIWEDIKNIVINNIGTTVRETAQQIKVILCQLS